MSIDLINALATGGTVAGAIKGLNAIEAFFAHRNGTNGNGNKFSIADHDALTRIEEGVKMLHDDLEGLRQDQRDRYRGRE